jgi:hypothetical protein
MGCGCSKRAALIRDTAEKHGVKLPPRVQAFLEHKANERPVPAKKDNSGGNDDNRRDSEAASVR